MSQFAVAARERSLIFLLGPFLRSSSLQGLVSIKQFLYHLPRWRIVDIQVLGGGALGMASALSLAEAGHDVVLREKLQLGAGATAKAAGIVSTMCGYDDEYGLIAETRGLIGELMSLAAGAVPESRFAWKPYESITVAKGEGLARMDEMQDRLERNTEEPERLGYREAAAEFKGVQFAPGEEVLVAQEDGVLEASDFLAALRWRLESEGVEIEQGAPTEIDGPTVVAGGAWTKKILADAGHAVPLKPFRVQLSNWELPGTATDLPIVHDLVHGFYTRPESEHTMLAGDGSQCWEFDPEDYNERGDPEFVESIAARLHQRFTGMDEAKARSSWAGLVAATPDTHALVGEVAEDLWVCSGDNGYGLMRCLALGERLAEAVDGARHDWLAPDRFGEIGADWQIREGYG
jgi:sarcosine oxidase subunit beta